MQDGIWSDKNWFVHDQHLNFIISDPAEDLINTLGVIFDQFLDSN